MRSIVFAYQDVGYVGLEALLASGDEVTAVFTHDDDPGETIWFRSVRALAEQHGIPVFTPERIEPALWVDRFAAWAPDFIFSFYYRRLIPTAILDTARRGALNLHGSLLPKYRGRCPVNWVIIHGERETGVTLHYMEAKADRGDIVAQRRVPITDRDTARTLYAKLTEAAAVLFRETYPLLRAGSAPRIPQDHGAATYFGGRTPADGLIEWAREGAEIYNLIRAVTHPYPGAFTHWQGQPLLIWEARVTDEHAPPSPAPGTIVGVEGGLIVQTRKGHLVATRVQIAGEPEVSGTEFARRYGVGKGSRLT